MQRTQSFAGGAGVSPENSFFLFSTPKAASYEWISGKKIPASGGENPVEHLCLCGCCFQWLSSYTLEKRRSPVWSKHFQVIPGFSEHDGCLCAAALCLFSLSPEQASEARRSHRSKSQRGHFFRDWRYKPSSSFRLRTLNPCFAIFSRSLSIPSMKASGRGGQPGTYISTGTMVSTP